MKQIDSIAGKCYIATAPNGGTVTDEAGRTLATVEAGEQKAVWGTDGKLYLSDDDGKLVLATFNHALAVAGLLGGGDKLPAGYTRLEFLESTGTQYIDTLLKPVANMSIRTKLQVTYYQDSVATSGAVGTYYNSEHPFVFMPQIRRGSSVFAFCGWAGLEGNIVNKYEEGVPYLLELKAQNGYVNGEAVEWTFRNAIPQKEGSSSYLLFAIYNTQGILSISRGMRCYELKDSVGESVRCSLLPALDPSGAPCMYDLVSKQAFRNAGSGQFIAGMTLAQAAQLGRKLPSTGGSLTISLPVGYEQDGRVAEALAQAEAKGWVLTIQTYDSASAVSTFALRRVLVRKVQDEYGSYVAADGSRWLVEWCVDVIGADPETLGYERFRSVEAAVEYWELVPYVDPNAEELSTIE